MGFARDARGVCGTQGGAAVARLGDGPGSWQHAAGAARGSGRRGGRGRAGSHAAGGAARMLSPALPRAGGGPGAGRRGQEAHAAAPTGAGSAAAASLSAGALPEPAGSSMCRGSPAVAVALCSSGSNSGRHGQVQHGAHPRAARYEAAVVSGTPGLGAFETQCAPPRGTPRPRCLPPRPRPMHPACEATPSPAPASQLRASDPGASSAARPRLTPSGPSCPRAARADLW